MRNLFFYTLVSFFIVCLAGCGQPDETAPVPDAIHSTVEETKASVVTKDGVTTVHISGNDRMKYSLETFSVKSGDTVKLVFENVGKMPKAAMGHNVVFLEEGVDEAAFATAASQARAKEYIPEGADGQILAYTRLLGPGESDTIEFVAPAPGEYVYLCSFPAHMYAGMKGIMEVTN